MPRSFAIQLSMATAHISLPKVVRSISRSSPMKASRPQATTNSANSGMIASPRNTAPPSSSGVGTDMKFSPQISLTAPSQTSSRA